jgi:beta-glucanase (GH16 family)
MKPRSTVLTAFLLVAGSALPTSADLLEGRELIWSDEFEGPAGQLPDSTKWQFDIGTDWGNRQLEWDTDRPENVSLDGQGNLAITAREEAFEGQPYSSGRIKTKDLFEQTYGRFEARIKVPVGQGMWPAFWMLGNDIDEVSWPQCGEIVVMGYMGHQPQVLYGAVHGPGYMAEDSISNRYLLPEGGFHEGFHVYAVEWSADRITWFVDGRKYHSVDPDAVPEGKEWVYDHPMFMILNVAVGGGPPGSPDENTQFPQSLLVDWVRVYAPTK